MLRSSANSEMHTSLDGIEEPDDITEALTTNYNGSSQEWKHVERDETVMCYIGLVSAGLSKE